MKQVESILPTLLMLILFGAGIYFLFKFGSDLFGGLFGAIGEGGKALAKVLNIPLSKKSSVCSFSIGKERIATYFARGLDMPYGYGSPCAAGFEQECSAPGDCPCKETGLPTGGTLMDDVVVRLPVGIEACDGIITHVARESPHAIDFYTKEGRDRLNKLGFEF